MNCQKTKNLQFCWSLLWLHVDIHKDNDDDDDDDDDDADDGDDGDEGLGLSSSLRSYSPPSSLSPAPWR